MFWDGCADRWDTDQQLKDSNAQVRPKRCPKNNPLLGWDNITPIDPKILAFYQEKGLEFEEGGTEAEFLDALAIHMLRNVVINEAGEKKSAFLRGGKDRAATLPRHRLVQRASGGEKVLVPCKNILNSPQCLQRIRQAVLVEVRHQGLRTL